MKNMLFYFGIFYTIITYSADQKQASLTIEPFIQRATTATENAQKAATLKAEIQKLIEEKQRDLEQAQENERAAEAEKINAEIAVLEYLAQKLSELFTHLKENKSSQQYERTVSGWAGTTTHKDVFATTNDHELILFIPTEGTITDSRMQEIASGLRYLVKNSTETSFPTNNSWERCEQTADKITCTQRIIQSLENQKPN